MTTRPEPPAHVYALPKVEIEDLADAAAEVIRQARADGRIIPASVTMQGYGASAISLFISASDTDDIWTALQEWATRYGTALRHSAAGTDSTSTRAELSWMRDGIRVEVHSLITTPAPDPWADTDADDPTDEWPDTPNPAA